MSFDSLRRALVPLGAGMVGALATSSAVAQTPAALDPPTRDRAPPPHEPSPAHWKIAVGAGTDFPVDVAGRIDAETPFRLRLNTSLGILPGPYVKAMNAALEDLGAYDAATGNLIAATLQSSFVWRTHLGYRPFRKLGLYGDVGYGFVSLGGNTTTSEVLAGVAGTVPPAADAATADKPLSIKSTLHMVDVEIGYEIPLARHWEVRGAIGGAFTVAASTTVTPDYTSRAPAATTKFANDSAAYLNHELTSYVFTPVFSLGAAYVF